MMYRRETPHYPSSKDTRCNTSRKEPDVYTGDVVKSIATMHKSNPIPVTSGFNTNPKKHEGGT